MSSSSEGIAVRVSCSGVSEKPISPGTIIGLYLVLSSIVRFLIEFTRFHEQALPFGLPFSITQWIAIGLALAGGVICCGRRTRDV